MQETKHSRIEVFGSKTFFTTLGDPRAKSILLVHGFRGDHHGLLKIAAGLKNYNIVIPDLPGFGESAALTKPHTLENLGEWLFEFAKQTMPQEFFLLGHSFGSLIVSSAIERGLDPKKIILINPISQKALEGPKRFLTNLATFYYRLGTKLPASFAERWLKSPLIVRAMSEAMAKTKDSTLRAWIHNQHHMYFSDFSDRKTLLQSYETSISSTVLEFSSHFQKPTLLLVGEHDDITPLSAQLSLQKSLKSAKMHVFAETGHLIHYERAEESARLIQEFCSD